MQLSDLEWPVTTERLSIRPARVSDADQMFAYRSQERVARWLPSLPDDPEAWTGFVAERLGSTLAVEHDGVLIGELFLHLEDPWSQIEVRDRAVGMQAEIGYVLDPAHTGRGYATEAVRGLLGIAFDGYGVRRVVAQCFAANEESWRLIERVGMRREQHTRQDSLHRSGEWLDGLMYALLADEWRAAAASGEPAQHRQPGQPD